jgi:hypothetical protein
MCSSVNFFLQILPFLNKYLSVNFLPYTNIQKLLFAYIPFRLLQRFDFPAMKFSLYFMGYEKAEDIPSDGQERVKWTFTRPATIELTQYVLCFLNVFSALHFCILEHETNFVDK